jgi:hypothetical protein
MKAYQHFCAIFYIKSSKCLKQISLLAFWLEEAHTKRLLRGIKPTASGASAYFLGL